jgi:hypothetical protein
MSKAIIRVGYDQYVVEAKDALAIHEILAKAEHYHRTYRSAQDGGTTYHIWEQDMSSEMRDIMMMPDGLYRMAKLAGKPPEK